MDDNDRDHPGSSSVVTIALPCVPTREDARKSLVLALKEIDVRGDIRTTVEYLVQLLETKVTATTVPHDRYSTRILLCGHSI
jgi:biotin carboxylase